MRTALIAFLLVGCTPIYDGQYDDRSVVALGPAAREHHFSGTAPDHGCDNITRLVDHLANGPGESVRAAGIGEKLMSG